LVGWRIAGGLLLFSQRSQREDQNEAQNESPGLLHVSSFSIGRAAPRGSPDMHYFAAFHSFIFFSRSATASGEGLGSASFSASAFCPAATASFLFPSPARTFAWSERFAKVCLTDRDLSRNTAASEDAYLLS